jgi:adenine-specific DNA-methyltransferase
VYSDGLSGSLKYFKVDFVEITEKEYYEYADKLLLHVRELVELENAVNFEGNGRISIVLTEDELENFCKNNSGEVKTLYLGHDVLLGKEQKELFKKSGITIKIIPQYYYPELNG